MGSIYGDGPEIDDEGFRDLDRQFVGDEELRSAESEFRHGGPEENLEDDSDREATTDIVSLESHAEAVPLAKTTEQVSPRSLAEEIAGWPAKALVLCRDKSDFEAIRCLLRPHNPKLISIKYRPEKTTRFTLTNR